MTKSSFNVPRRTASGFDFNRANLLVAVLEKRAGYFFGSLDVYLNIVGGLEPVSYTHLDVYKRQARAGPSAPAWPSTTP